MGARGYVAAVIVFGVVMSFWGGAAASASEAVPSPLPTVSLAAATSPKTSPSQLLPEPEALSPSGPGVIWANRGQLEDPRVLFYGSAGAAQWGFTKGAVLLHLREEISIPPTPVGAAAGEPGVATARGVLLRLVFVGAEQAEPEGAGVLAQVGHFFLGNDPARWQRDVPGFGEVRYADAYPGIDLVFHGSSAGLKYDVVARPGADLSGVSLRYEGVTGMRIEGGDLVATTVLGELRDHAPLAYAGGDTIDCDFVPHGALSYGFSCEAWDPAEVLVIDPLVWSTYLGSSSDERGTVMAVDAGGNTLLSGYTQSIGFPYSVGAYQTTYQGGFEDVYVTKINATGTGLVFSTFLGGLSQDNAYGLAVDATGVYVAGGTASSGFPTTPGSRDTSFNGGYDAFITKLNLAGSALLYSTFYGSTDDEYVSSIALSPSGEVYGTGYSYSSGFPTTVGAFQTILSGAPDAFIVKLNAAGSQMNYSSFVGGSAYEYAPSIAVDASGNAFIAGNTASANFPTTVGAYDTSYNGGAYDVFVLGLNATGASRVYATYLGSTGSDTLGSIALTASGAVYLAGTTTSVGFPTTVGAWSTTQGGLSDAFVARLDPTGTLLERSTFLGDTGDETAGMVRLGPSGEVIVSGSTNSGSFPTTPNALFTTYRGGAWDGYVAEFDGTLSTLLYSTFIGGSAEDRVFSVFPDPGGELHLSGYTYSANFPTTLGAYDRTANGGMEIFAARLNLTGISVLVETSPPGLQVVVDGLPYTAPVTSNCLAGVTTVDAPTPQGAGPTRFVFASWSDGGSASHTLSCTDSVYTATFRTEHRVTVDTAPVPLEVTVDSVLVTAPQFYWWVEGSVHDLAAAPLQTVGAARYLFGGWSDSGALSHSVTITAPGGFTAAYASENQVWLLTDPPGLQLQVDGNSVVGPFAFWCPPSASAMVSAPSPQDLGGVRYSFGSWSDGGAQAHAVSCGSPASYTATFAETAYLVTVDTDPPGLQVEVDGVGHDSPYSFWCAAGSSPLLNAPSPQGIGSVRSAFLNWSDAGAAGHVIPCSAPAGYTARFWAEYQSLVTTSPPGLEVIVDGVPGVAPQSAWWPAGSAHTLDVASPQTNGPTRHLFASWSDLGARSHGVVADGPATFTAVFTAEHEVTIDTLPSGLDVLVDGVQITAPWTEWCPEGDSLALGVATPQPAGTTRYAFSSWSDGGAASHPVGCGAPATFIASFGTEYLVTLGTSPPGLLVLVDGLETSTPFSFWCAASSSHVVSAPSPQTAGSTRRVYTSWSDAGDQSHSVVCGGALSLTATFGDEHLVTVDTIPPALTVLVDGVPTTAPFSAWWPAGSTHPVDVPTPQGYGDTRRVFASWSDAGPRAHSVQATAPTTLVVSFVTEHRVVLDSVPPGLPLLVDGALSPAPASFWWPENSTHEVGATPVQTVEGTACEAVFVCEFVSWSDGGARTHTVTVEAPSTLTASYRTAIALWVWLLLGAVIGVVALLVAFLVWRRRKCPSCGGTGKRSARFCDRCGVSFEDASPAPARAPSPPAVIGPPPPSVQGPLPPAVEGLPPPGQP